MHEIAGIQNGIVFVRTPNGLILSVAYDAIQYQYPNIGDKVTLMWDGQLLTVFPLTTQCSYMQPAWGNQAPSFCQTQQSFPYQQTPYYSQSNSCLSHPITPGFPFQNIGVQQPILQNSPQYAVGNNQQSQQDNFYRPVASQQPVQISQDEPSSYEADEPHSSDLQSTVDVLSQGQKGVKKINKHLFTWVLCGLVGNLGVDRFFRGQILLGVIKLLTFGGFLIWGFLDWIIAISKAYGSAFSDRNDFVFVDGKYAR